MRSAFVLIYICLSLLAAKAEDWTVDGKEYHNVVVGKIEADKVHITYDGGLGTIMLARLPADLQKRFNYDPVAAAKAISDEQAKEAAAAAVLAQETTQRRAAQPQQPNDMDALKAHAESIVIKVTQVLANGVLAEKMTSRVSAPAGDSRDSDKVTSYVDLGVAIYVEMSTSGAGEGQLVTVKAAQNGSYRFTDDQGIDRTLEKWTQIDN